MTIRDLIAKLEGIEKSHGNIVVIKRTPADYEYITEVQKLIIEDYGIGVCGGYVGKPSKHTKKALMIE